MKYAVLTACVAAIALGACRRERHHEYVPMKLGASVEAPVKR